MTCPAAGSLSLSYACCSPRPCLAPMRGGRHTPATLKPYWGYGLLGVGIVFGLVIGCGLMALAFYSSRSGHDESTVVQRKDRDLDDHHSIPDLVCLPTCARRA